MEIFRAVFMTGMIHQWVSVYIESGWGESGWVGKVGWELNKVLGLARVGGLWI